MSKRKVVQLMFVQRDERHAGGIVALCDDGTMWSGDLNTHDADWQRLPDVPQPEPKDGPFYAR